VELFQVPLEESQDPAFTLTEEQLGAYNPAAWFTSTEMIDVRADLDSWPTEDTLQILTNGLPVSQLPVLGRYPAGPVSGGGSSAGSGPAPASPSFPAPPGP